jgi:hypothetical protein
MLANERFLDFAGAVGINPLLTMPLPGCLSCPMATRAGVMFASSFMGGLFGGGLGAAEPSAKYQQHSNKTQIPEGQTQNNTSRV